MSRGWAVIINPRSGAGATKKKISILKRLLDSEKIQASYFNTRSAGDEINVVDRAIKDGFRKFICAGGDGTIQKIVAGIQIQQTCNPKEVVVGIIPFGTGNDWAKSIEIPLNIKKAIKKIKREKTKKRDLGVVLIKTKRQMKKRYFINYSGVGFDAFMLNRLGPYKWLGKYAYLACSIANFWFYKNRNILIESKGFSLSRSVFLCGAGVSKYTGGGMQIIKNPAGNNGLLNLTVAYDFSKIDIIKNFFNLFNGSIFNDPKVLTILSNKIKIASKTGFLTCHGDGEIFGSGNLTFFVLKKQITHIC